MNLIEAEVAGLEVILDALRHDEQDHIWLISMAGQQTAIRGAWASLLQGSVLAIESTRQRLCIPEPREGWSAKATRVGDPRRLGRSFGHMVMLPPCTDSWSTQPEILIVEHAKTTHQATLMRFLASRSTLPLDDAWADQLWAWAEGNGSIATLRGHGPQAWLATIKDEQLLADFLPRFKS